MTGLQLVTALAVSLVVVLTVFFLPDTVTAGEQLAAFGFLAAPFKLIGKAGAAVVKVAKKVPRFVARNAPVIAGTLVAGPFGAALAGVGGKVLGGGGGQPPDLAASGIVPITQDFPVSSRFNLASTFEAILQQARGEAERLVERASEGVTVKPQLKGALPVILGIGGTVGVIGLVAGAVALARA